MYTGHTLETQHQHINDLFNRHPEMLEFFGDRWLKDHLLLSQPIDQKDAHPLFFAFANEMRNERLVANLKAFWEFKPERRSALCTRLRESTNRNQAESCLNEIDAFVFMRRRFESCEWEPPVPGTNNKADLNFQLDNDLIFVEAVSIFSSASDTEISDIERDVQAKVNQIPNNHYCIGLDYEYPFFDTHKNVELLIDFIKKQIESGELSTDPNEVEERVLEVDATVLAEVSFSYVSDDVQGFVGTFSGPGGRRNDSARIKNRLMTKMQNFQLPTNGQGIGGYLVFLNDTWCGFSDFVDALHGRETVNFFSDGRPSTQGRSNRESLCITDEAAEKMNHIQFFVVVEDPSQYWFHENVRVFTNNEGSLSKEKLISAFTTEECETDPALRWIT